MENKLWKQWGAALAVLLLFVCLTGETVLAADTYTVTFRAGNAGTFDTEKLSDLNEGVLTESTANYFTVTLERGTDVMELFGTETDMNLFFKQAVVCQSGYILMPASHWGPSQDTVLTKNLEYVVDYGRQIKRGYKGRNLLYK